MSVTWGELKRKIEAEGVKEDTILDGVDINQFDNIEEIEVEIFNEEDGGVVIATTRIY